MRDRRLGWVLLVIAGWGCGGGGGDPSIPQLFDELVSNECTRLFACMSQFDPSMHGSDTFADYAGGSSVAACETSATAGEGSSASQAQAEVDAGRVKYDGAAGQACLDAIANDTCDDVLQQNGGEVIPAACADVFVGLVATGSACVDQEDCAVTTDFCNGTCMPETPGSGA